MYRNILTLCSAAAAVFIALSASNVLADDHEVIEEAMKKFHKSPKGTDPICKKITNGQGSDEELAGILECYVAMCKAKPPKGEVGPWQDKCKALIAAIKGVQAKESGALEKYKEAVNCKACHKEHKPD